MLEFLLWRPRIGKWGSGTSADPFLRVYRVMWCEVKFHVLAVTLFVGVLAGQVAEHGDPAEAT